MSKQSLNINKFIVIDLNRYLFSQLRPNIINQFQTLQPLQEAHNNQPMQTQDDILQHLQKDIATLLQSPPSYMRQITRVSQKVVSLEIKYIFFVLNKIHHLIHDSSVSIKKKLFAFRFIKDTLLLASRSFYVLTVVRILPFMVQVLAEGNRQSDHGLEFLIKKIGPKLQVSNAVEIKTFSTTLLQLINQIMKWTGTHIKIHPFYTIPYSSIFKLYLESFPKVKAIKITDLTYFTTDSVNTYEQNFLQRQLMSEAQSKNQAIFIDLLINNWISLPQDDEEKKGSLKLLQNIVETGDSNFIRHMIDCLKLLVQSQIIGYQAIQVLHALLKVREIQTWFLARDKLLYSIAYYVIMMSKEKFSKLENIDLMEILRHVFVWKMNAVKMGLKTQAYDQFFRKMKNQWICANQSQYTSNTGKIQRTFEGFQYYLSQDKLQNINEEKKRHLNLKDDQNAINKIRFLTYQKRAKSHREDSYFEENSLYKGNQSINKDQKSLFNKIGSINKKNEIIVEEPRVTFQTIESPSPIKQFKINNIGKSFESKEGKESKVNQEYIQFNNSLHNLSSSKEIVKAERQNIARNNIYTAKVIEQDKKSSRSIRSNQSSKKSLGKLEKASSLGLGVQRIKSSKIINSHGEDYNTKSVNRQTINSKNEQKLKLLKFDESSQSIHYNNIGSPRNQDSLSSDNRPYKQQNSQSINQNNHSYVGYSQTIRSNRKQLRNQQVIVVQETIRKPKFAFIQIKNDDDEGTDHNSPQKVKNKKNANDSNQIQGESFESIGVDPELISEQKASQYSSIPSDFKAVFGKKLKGKHRSKDQEDSGSELGIKFNKFPHKVKQLQMQIQKAKQYQRLYQQRMREKDEDYQNILKTLPQGHQRVHQQNKRLQRQLQEKQRKQALREAMREQRMYKSPNSRQLKPQQQIPFLPNNIFSLGKIKPYEPTFVKQLISGRCLLLKNQIFQVGYAFKTNKQQGKYLEKQRQYWICLYFKFRVRCDRVEFRVKQQGLVLKESLQGKVMNVVANKQLKFQQRVVGYVAKNEEFRVAYLDIQVIAQQEALKLINSQRGKQKQAQVQSRYQITVPCTLINFLQFHTPFQPPQTIKTKYAIQAQFSNKQLNASLKGEYLLNSLRCGKWHQKHGEPQGGVYVALNTYVKGIRDKKLLKDKDIKVYFDELQGLQKRVVNFCVRKINGNMFYIEADGEFDSDKMALLEISRVLTR